MPVFARAGAVGTPPPSSRGFAFHCLIMKAQSHDIYSALLIDDDLFFLLMPLRGTHSQCATKPHLPAWQKRRRANTIL